MAENTNTEREAFESALIKLCAGFGEEIGESDLDRTPSGAYVNGSTEVAWMLWQARASLSLPAAGQEPVAPPMDGEIALIEKALERAGISSLLNHGAASCVFTEGCCGVSQDQILAYTREIALHCAVALGAAPQPAVAAGWMLIARALDEWHEDDGPVMWWAWNGSASGWAGEPAWCGTPLYSDWPGYHTHWTPHPTFPPAPSAEGESNG